MTVISPPVSRQNNRNILSRFVGWLNPDGGGVRFSYFAYKACLSVAQITPGQHRWPLAILSYGQAIQYKTLMWNLFIWINYAIRSQCLTQFTVVLLLPLYRLNPMAKTNNCQVYKVISIDPQYMPNSVYSETEAGRMEGRRRFKF